MGNNLPEFFCFLKLFLSLKWIGDLLMLGKIVDFVLFLSVLFLSVKDVS